MNYSKEKRHQIARTYGYSRGTFVYWLIEDLDEQETILTDCVEMGARLAKLIEKMRDENEAHEEEQSQWAADSTLRKPPPHHPNTIDELAQIATVLLGANLPGDDNESG